MALSSRFDLVRNVRSLEARDALVKRFKLEGAFLDEETFHALVAKTKAQTEEASIEGKHVRKRLTHGEHETAEAERFAEMERKGIEQTREGFADTGDRSFGKQGLENVVIDGLLEQLERGYNLFGVRLEQKAARYTKHNVKRAQERGLKVKAGDPIKTESGGEVFHWKLRFLFFRKDLGNQHLAELFALLMADAKECIHGHAHCYENDGDIHTLELSGEPRDMPSRVNRALHDETGFYSKQIENSDQGMATPIERRPSLKASLDERLKSKSNGDTPVPPR